MSGVVDTGPFRANLDGWRFRRRATTDASEFFRGSPRDAAGRQKKTTMHDMYYYGILVLQIESR